MKKNIAEQLEFKGKWRNYQAKVLNQLNYHLEDKRLHVVAAPGAGKTILGIEVIHKLGKPALILSPTIVIKNQWKERIIQNFLPSNLTEDSISSELTEVKEITTGTYQRLHAIEKKNLLNEFIEELKKHNIKTLVLDEAHHLRMEWYKTLNAVVETLSEDPEFKIVSLTATPPYDVKEKEWNNYYGLCGPIDTEISIPELVKNKNLCPHQDLLYFSFLDEAEKKAIYDFEINRDKFFKYINNESDLLYSVETSTFLNDFENNFELIYEDTDFTISLISYLFSIDKTHLKATYLMNFLELKQEQIPEFDYEIAKNLFDGILGKFKKHFKNIPTFKTKLKEYNLLKNASRVDFYGETDFKKLFARSQNKLKSIEAITRLEYESLGENLREVILLDHIGKENNADRLNIISAFNMLQQNKPKELKLAILTGTIVVIDKTCKPLLEELIKTNNLEGKILCAEYNENYLRVESYGNADIVGLITEFFYKGGAHVLIGTHSLLGEGWDSPCINSLIIGSVVASFMLSNQMRGRALRMDKNNPEKTANIWHLLAIETGLNKGFDFDVISRRFDTFDGISYFKNTIQSGLDRLGVNLDVNNSEDIEKLNKSMMIRANSRNSLAEKWIDCLRAKKSIQVYEGQIYQGISIETASLEYVLGKKVYKLTQREEKWNKFIDKIFRPDSMFLNFTAILLLAAIIGNITFSTPYVLETNFLLFFSYMIIAITTLARKEGHTEEEIKTKLKEGGAFVRDTGTAGISIIMLGIVTSIFSLIMGIPVILIGLLLKTSKFERFMYKAKYHCSYLPTYMHIADALIKTLCRMQLITTPYNKIELVLEENILKLKHCSRKEEDLFRNTFNEIFGEHRNEPKYILQLKKQKNKNIIPPYILKRKDVEFFAEELTKKFGKIEIVGTRTMLGKRELLKARYNDFIQGTIKQQRSWS